jgi:hypothetical protein
MLTHSVDDLMLARKQPGIVQYLILLVKRDAISTSSSGIGQVFFTLIAVTNGRYCVRRQSAYRF